MTSDRGGASEVAAACESMHGATTDSQRAGLKVFTNAVGNRTSSELLREDDQILAHPVEIPETRFFPIRHRLIKAAGGSVGLESRSFDPHQPRFAAPQIPFHRGHQGAAYSLASNRWVGSNPIKIVGALGHRSRPV